MTPEERRELGDAVAKRMGYVYHSPGAPSPRTTKPINCAQWDYPDGSWDFHRPDFEGKDWWQVVKHMRKQDRKFQVAFIHCLLEIWTGTSEIVKAPIVWFLLDANPGRAICEAFVKAMADG